MTFRVTADDISRAKRILQDPFDSKEIQYTVYPQRIVNDDGLFKHGEDWVPCHGCQPDLYTGEATWSHGHIVLEGSNGGIRCQPLTDESLRALARDCLYSAPATSAIRCIHDAGQTVLVLALSSESSREELPLRLSPVAETYLHRNGLDALEILVGRGLLFSDSDNDT